MTLDQQRHTLMAFCCSIKAKKVLLATAWEFECGYRNLRTNLLVLIRFL